MAPHGAPHQLDVSHRFWMLGPIHAKCNLVFIRQSVVASGRELQGASWPASARSAFAALPGHVTPKEKRHWEAFLSIAASMDLKIQAHVQDFGDRDFDSGGWVRLGDSKSIEGFAIFAPTGMDSSDLRYCSLDGSGVLTDWHEGGQFCGSRGRSQPLTGICVEFSGSAAEAFDWCYSASFADGATVGPVQYPEVCCSPQLSRMVAFRLEVRPRTDAARTFANVRQTPRAALPRPPSVCLTVGAAYDAKLRNTFPNRTTSALVCLPSAATFVRFVFGNATNSAYSLKAYWAPTAHVGNGWSPYRPDGMADPALFVPVTFNGAGADLVPEEVPAGHVAVATVPANRRAYFSDWMPTFGPLVQTGAADTMRFILVRTQAAFGAGFGLTVTAGVNHDGLNVGGASANFSGDDGIDRLADTSFVPDCYTHLLATQICSSNAGYSVLYAGSSILAGTSTTPLGRQSFVRIACRAMTVAGTPFAAIQADVRSDPRTSVIAASAIAKIEAFRPDFVLMQVSNRNDVPPTLAMQDEIWADAMRVADAAIRAGGTPILVTATPWPPDNAPDAAADTLRQFNNNRARASDLPVFDYDALLTDGGSPARLPAKYNDSGDGTHPGNTGHAYAAEKLAALFASLIAAPS